MNIIELIRHNLKKKTTVYWIIYLSCILLNLPTILYRYNRSNGSIKGEFGFAVHVPVSLPVLMQIFSIDSLIYNIMGDKLLLNFGAKFQR